LPPSVLTIVTSSSASQPSPDTVIDSPGETLAGWTLSVGAPWAPATAAAPSATRTAKSAASPGRRARRRPAPVDAPDAGRAARGPRPGDGPLPGRGPRAALPIPGFMIRDYTLRPAPRAAC